MNYVSEPRRLELEEQAYNADRREDWEKLRDAVEVHIANCETRSALVDAAVTDVDAKAFNSAERACENSYSDLACLIEDTFCVSAERLAKALSL